MKRNVTSSKKMNKTEKTTQNLIRYRSDQIEAIREHGQHVVRVMGETWPFAYTVGNSKRGLPELLLIGSNSDAAKDALDAMGKMMRDRGRPFEEGETVDLGKTPLTSFPVKVINATDPAALRDYACQAHKDAKVQQVLMLDKAGRFPDQVGCAEPYSTILLMRSQP
jgi:hypothetical protein